ncbi:dienelactone hydrolase family protein [Sphingobium yanoikuyae]|uniref:dienelactone hydrolase family protein n=1 Tax=Sphingobium yanoikuyae TaxID=13690 RepID=UPI0022DD97BE|nr:dienelactone hydrolase family protein [Sphingobium yanoikuyae]WBQ18968.1 dienelactone hydrolase family protein [Sphingobium yanoikuyae]
MNDTGGGEPYAYYDGNKALLGELFRPRLQPNGRAVLVIHEADGIGGNVRRHCRKLADLGYTALAADMHGNGEPLEGEAMRDALDAFRNHPDLVRGRVRSGFDALLSATGVHPAASAAIGFCFGGFAALELARSGAEIAAVASFHGLLTTARPAQVGGVKARIAVFTGARDPLVPHEDVGAFQREMMQAQAHWQLTTHGNAWHSFTNEDVDRLDDARMAYDAAAHMLSWRALIDFLNLSLASQSIA